MLQHNFFFAQHNIILLQQCSTWINPHGQIKKGGGVCCYINTSIKFTHQEFDNLNCSNKDIENHHILIEQPSIKKCILLNIYRPPQGNIDNFTEKILNNITYLNNKYPNAEIIMLGDFNLNVIDKNSDDARHVKWIEQATGLKQYIDGITRYSNNNSSIDLLFTNMVNNFSVNILDLNISDHQFIHINRAHVPREKSKLEFTGRSYKSYDQNVFQNKLLAKDWNALYTNNDVNQTWDIMLSNVMSVIVILLNKGVAMPRTEVATVRD